MTKIYEMKLHEIIRLNYDWTVLRVPGGWIYYRRFARVFVPYDEEFKWNENGNN